MTSRSAFSLIPFRGWLVVPFLTFFAPGDSPAAEDTLSDSISSEVQEVFQERRSAVVQVEAIDRHGRQYCTGFFTDPMGTIYTLATAVADAEEIYVIQGLRKIPAKLLVADGRSGIALLRADANSPFIPIGDANKLELGSLVVVVGYPKDLDVTPSFGIVGGFDCKYLGKYFVTKHIRANVPVQYGFGGAPLMNLKGEVVGILIRAIDGFGACYALPIEAAEKIRGDYVRFGEIRHGWVGVNVKDEEDAVEGSRARIANLEPETPAAQSGLQDGDILLQVGSVKITTVEDVPDASFFLTAGDQTSVTVLRNGTRLTVNVRSVRHPLSELKDRFEAQDIIHVLAPSPTPEGLRLDEISTSAPLPLPAGANP